jgi:hypothetical protein
MFGQQTEQPSQGREILLVTTSKIFLTTQIEKSKLLWIFQYWCEAEPYFFSGKIGELGS